MRILITGAAGQERNLHVRGGRLGRGGFDDEPEGIAERLAQQRADQAFRGQECQAAWSGRQRMRVIAVSQVGLRCCAMTTRSKAVQSAGGETPVGMMPAGSESSRRKRTGRDSNPRYRCRYTGFRDRLLQPLGHLSWYCSTAFGTEVYTRPDWFTSWVAMRNRRFTRLVLLQ